jgi:bis(5'-nucleosidyl)-tetraphosphatase
MLCFQKDFDIVKDFTVELRYEAETPQRGKEQKVVTYWLAKLSQPEKEVTLSEEHQDFRWLPLQEACDLAGYEDMQNALKKCEEKLTAS